MADREQLVRSWNEWDRLEEVVVGRADGAQFEPSEPACRPSVRGSGAIDPFPSGAKSRSSIELANNELDNLASVLVDRGVKVQRPTAVDFSIGLRTPSFAVPNQYCAVCPRDVMITIGPEVLEATMSRRARFFEYQAYRPLVYDYWRSDPDMIWSVAPKPSMNDEMYNQGFWDQSAAERHTSMHSFEFCVTQDEIVLDAADMVRVGRDVFVQESMTTNRAGIEWLTRHLSQRGLRVRPLHFPLDRFPSHIDCTFVPLRPGLVLTNPERPLREDESTLFLTNGWEFVDAPEPVLSDKSMPSYCQSSKWLSMNVLSISPTTVICEASEFPLHELLSSLGFEVIEVPFRNVFEFGGSLHCATWDIRREGACEDWFPLLP